TVPDRALAADEPLARHAVARVDLDAPGRDQLLERIDDVKPFDLLGIAAGGGEQQHRGAEVPPADELHVALDAMRIPAHPLLHADPFAGPWAGPRARSTAAVSSRQRWMRVQNSSVNASTSCAG